MRNPIVADSELSTRFQDLSPNDIEAIRLHAEEKLIVAALNQMCSPSGTDIWYDEALGIWQLAKSCVDELRLERKRARAAMSALGGSETVGPIMAATTSRLDAVTRRTATLTAQLASPPK